uniref:guanylyl cyclase C-like n=1 Tax=Myxine glutinosa TaxID=7769 RepID=UPI00358FD6B1
MVLVIFGCILLWRIYKMEKQLCKQRWIIPWHLLRMLPAEDNQSTHEVRRRKIDYNEKVIESCFLKFNLRKYDNKVVVLKPLDISEKELSKKQKVNLHEFTMLDVENLAKFYGTTSCNSIATTYAVFEYCNRGSLWDVLEDRMTYPENSFVDWHWKVSTMNEIAKGMAYLHSTLNTLHGHLKSTNCVVDSSMVVKVTDFTLAVENYQTVYTKQQDLRDLSTHCHQPFGMWTALGACWRKRARVQQKSTNYTDFKPDSKLWTAPEHLHNDGASQKGDVYSFGIILQELLYRRGVFFIRDGSFSHDEIIKRLCSEDVPGAFRPTLEPEIVTDKAGGKEVLQIISNCWDPNPDKRLDFSKLSAILRKTLHLINKDETYMDTLLQRLEQYSQNLEHLVEERIALYKQEQDRADRLNYQLLPKSVVKVLKARHSVEPELFDMVTIYFSDIMGFTTICKHSEPVEIVLLLNELYKEFDDIVDSYDVYKVETIRDAYMVVSGLPQRNGQAHATQVADMALELLKSVGSFSIPHLPGLPLWVRIGVHSGPCAAGVLGNKMPRYCLFGDTVNMASRIESTCLPCRIHVSESTVKLLKSLQSGHIFEERGLIELKVCFGLGRGSVATFWLVGKEGVEMSLPDPPKIEQVSSTRDTFEKMILSIKRRSDSSPQLALPLHHGELRWTCPSADLK